MMDEREELYEFAAWNLRELAWHRCLPLHPKVMFQGFIFAMKGSGYDILRRRGAIEASLNIGYSGKDRIVKAGISKEEILECWGNYPRGSPNTIYNAAFEIRDRVLEEMTIEEKSVPGKPEVFDFRDRFDEFLLDKFRLYHEYMFVGRDGQVSGLSQPSLIERILENFPWGIYRNSRFIDRNDHDTYGLPVRFPPEAIDVYTGDWEADIDKGHYPTGSVMEDYFWGLFLFKLCRMKDYPLRDSSHGLADLMQNGWMGVLNAQQWV